MATDAFYPLTMPLTVGQEWSGHAAQLAGAIDHVERSRRGLYELALGGTAVGTGLNAPAGFDPRRQWSCRTN